MSNIAERILLTKMIKIGILEEKLNIASMEIESLGFLAKKWADENEKLQEALNNVKEMGIWDLENRAKVYWESKTRGGREPNLSDMFIAGFDEARKLL